MPLAGGPLGFSACEVALRQGRDPARRVLMTVAELDAWAEGLGKAARGRLEDLLTRLSSPRPELCGLALERPLIMGVVNVTPDSFSDGGDHADSESAILHARRLLAAGADILDVGGESMRPGAEPVAEAEERARVLPVIEALRDLGVPISVDTRRARVMAAALAAGAAMINDVSALRYDADSLGTAARSGVPVVLMHSRGEPRTMQDRPAYDDVPLDVYDDLEGRIEACLGAGIPRHHLIVDPGIGFAKTTEHTVEILKALSLLHGLGCVLMLGASRKSFIARLSADEAPKERLPGSLAAALWGLSQGVQILRVHDVAETRQALALWAALGPFGAM